MERQKARRWQEVEDVEEEIMNFIPIVTIDKALNGLKHDFLPLFIFLSYNCIIYVIIRCKYIYI